MAQAPPRYLTNISRYRRCQSHSTGQSIITKPQEVHCQVKLKH
jgi:hypothetical protein